MTDDSEFGTVPKKTIRFSDQTKIGSWSKESVRLTDGVMQFLIIAHKTGVSSNIHYVMINLIKLSACSEEGRCTIYFLLCALYAGKSKDWFRCS